MTQSPIIRAGASLDSITRRVSRVNQLPIFFEDWDSFYFNSAKWRYAIATTGTVNIAGGTAAVGKPSTMAIQTGTTSGALAQMYSRNLVFPIRHGHTAATTTIKRTWIEIVMSGIGLATSIDNTRAWFGIVAQANNFGTPHRQSNSIFGFGWASDVLQTFSDNAGTETTQATTNVITWAATLHKYGISLDADNGLRFYVDDVLEATITTNIPNNIAEGTISFEVLNDAAANIGFDLGEIRVWEEDVV